MKNIEKLFNLLEDSLGEYNENTGRGCLRNVTIKENITIPFVYECLDNVDGGVAVLEDESFIKHVREESVYTPILVDKNKTTLENYMLIITECFSHLEERVRLLENNQNIN